MDPVTPVLPAVLAVLGMVVGSVLDLVARRLSEGSPVLPLERACENCAAAVPGQWLPVAGALPLAGRCSGCGRSPGLGRLGTEVVTAALFGALGAVLGATWELPAYLYLAAVSMALALVDLRTKRLPNVLTLPSYPIFAGLLLVAAAAQHDGAAYVRALLGGLALFLAYLLLAVVNPAGMGLGDVKLAGVLGIALGWFGWDLWLLGAVLAFVLAAVVGLGLLLTRHARRRSTIPFGPFMVAGTWIAVLSGPGLLQWYLDALV